MMDESSFGAVTYELPERLISILFTPNLDCLNLNFAIQIFGPPGGSSGRDTTNSRRCGDESTDNKKLLYVAL
jgi:hypothetical protein